jgi:hypothetical protein
VTRSPHEGLLWFGVLAGPAAWVVQLVAGYAFQEAACPPSRATMPVLDVDTETWIGAISVAAFVVAVLGALAALVSRQAVAAESDADSKGRIAFMADTGLLTSLIFIALIVLGAVALPSLDACDLG